jgi:hypothetical protein
MMARVGREELALHRLRGYESLKSSCLLVSRRIGQKGVRSAEKSATWIPTYKFGLNFLHFVLLLGPGFSEITIIIGVSFTAKRRVWTCEDCPKRRQFSFKVGTIMDASPISLDKWLVGMWLITSAKNGISFYELHRTLGITQKSAWFLSHRIRLGLQNGTIVKMGGTVEVDETFIGGKAGNMHKGKRKVKGTGPMAMTAVQGLLERHAGGSRGDNQSHEEPQTHRSPKERV